jgi:hypothetical protein
MKKICVLVILFILPFSSCRKDNSDIYSSGLLGEWSWIKSCGGEGGCNTPTTNYNIKLEFNVDYIQSIYENDTLTAKNKFTIRNNVICIDNSLNYSFNIKNDTLVMMTPNVTDLCQLSYKRIK